MIFEVENIKCGGCANGIRQKLTGIESIDDVSVDVESGQVTVVSADDSDSLKTTILTTLAGMGYPEKGSVEGLGSVKAKATSYVSCAIGKMSAE
jgi:copper chaperone